MPCVCIWHTYQFCMQKLNFQFTNSSICTICFARKHNHSIHTLGIFFFAFGVPHYCHINVNTSHYPPIDNKFHQALVLKHFHISFSRSRWRLHIATLLYSQSVHLFFLQQHHFNLNVKYTLKLNQTKEEQRRWWKRHWRKRRKYLRYHGNKFIIRFSKTLRFGSAVYWWGLHGSFILVNVVNVVGVASFYTIYFYMLVLRDYPHTTEAFFYLVNLCIHIYYYVHE